MDNRISTTIDNLIDPKELAQAFENTMHVVKGDYDALPAMMHDTGKLMLKLSSRLTTTQMILLVGALTLGAVFMVKRIEEAIDDNDQDQDTQKALPKSGSRGSQQGSSEAGSQKSGTSAKSAKG